MYWHFLGIYIHDIQTCTLHRDYNFPLQPVRLTLHYKRAVWCQEQHTLPLIARLRLSKFVSILTFARCRRSTFNLTLTTLNIKFNLYQSQIHYDTQKYNFTNRTISI